MRLPHPWDSPGKNTGLDCHFLLQYMKVKSESEVAQSCSTLSDPMDCSLPGSSIHGIFQARVLEWGAIAFSNTRARAHTHTHTYICIKERWAFLGSRVVKNPPANAGDSGLIIGLGRSSSGEGNGNPLQYSCLENPMDGGAW